MFRRNFRPPADALVALDRHTFLCSRSFTEHIFVCGATGSGKSSGVLVALLVPLLVARWGGFLTTTKGTDGADYRRLVGRAKRDDDLIVFDQSLGHRFNFLQRELTRPGPTTGRTENICRILETLVETFDRLFSGNQRHGDESFWKNATRRLLRALVDALRIGADSVSFPFLRELLLDLPQSRAETESDDWRKRSSAWSVLLAGRAKAKSPADDADWRLVEDYVLREYPSIPEKTRGTIQEMALGLFDVFSRGLLREMFSADTTHVPGSDGKIVLADLPVKSQGASGLLAQVLLKLAFQQEVERASDGHRSFLAVDECQEFVTKDDPKFLATARSSKCAVIALTQSLPGLFAAFGGGDAGRQAAEAWLANFNLKVFCANGCTETNRWAAETIGYARKRTFHASSPLRTGPFRGRDQGATAGFGETREYKIEPTAFTTLRRGGGAERLVDAICFRVGERFRQTNDNFMRAVFQQEER